MAKNYYIHLPNAIGETVTMSLDSGAEQTLANYGVEPEPAQTLNALGGRINIYNQAFTNPSAGKMTPRPGGGTTLNLLGVDDAQTITATGPDGAQVAIEVEQNASKSGWAEAEYYRPEQDPVTGDLIFKPGRNFWGVIYATASAAAYNAQKIADEVTAGGTAMTASQVTGSWLRNQSVYGRSKDKAITDTLAMSLINSMPKTDKVHPGWHLSLERGYDTYTAKVQPYNGETPLHPVLVTAWGTGTEPKGVIVGGIKQYVPQNNAFIGVAAKVENRNFENLLLADAAFYGDGASYAIAVSANPLSAGLTVYRAKILDSWKNLENRIGSSWSDDRNRTSGIYPSGVKGVLIELADLDHNGWAEGFLYDILASEKDPVDLLSHNGYISEYNRDICVADCLSTDPASAHFQIRPGGWLLGLVGVNGGFLNHMGQPRVGGAFPNEQGWFGYNERAVITSATPRRVSDKQGSVRSGFDLGGPYMSMVDCLVIHLADPDRPEEWSEKATNGGPIAGLSKVQSAPTYPAQHLGLVIYNWDLENTNVEGLDTELLDVTTIQRYANAVTAITGDPIRDYANYIRTLSPRDMQTEILNNQKFFLTAIAPKSIYRLDARTVAADIKATPSELTEGFRDDIGINFSTNDRPGTHPDDTLDLMGNDYKHVRYTDEYAACRFSGGSFTVSAGKLTHRAHLDEAKVIVGPHSGTCGKYFAPATTGDYEARGGLLVFTDAATVGLKASGNSEVVLGRNCTIPSGKALRVTGDMGWCGWDHADGTATLNVEGALEFEVTPVLEFAWDSGDSPWWLQLGHFLGGTSGATGKPDAWRKVGVTNYVRFRDVTGTPVAGETSVDASVIKSFATSVHAPVLTDVVGAEIGKLQRFRSGEYDTFDAVSGQWTLNEPGVTVTVNLSGSVSIPGMDWLTRFHPGEVFSLGGGAGTGVTYVNGGITLPSYLEIVDGELRLTVPVA